MSDNPNTFVVPPATTQRVTVRLAFILCCLFLGTAITEASSVYVLPLTIGNYTLNPFTIALVLALNPLFGIIAQPLAGPIAEGLGLKAEGAGLVVTLTQIGYGAGLLAVAGALMQVLLRNPLAEPYILGTSGGAAVAALSGMLLGWGAALIDAAAFAGALGSALLVFSIARGTGSWTPTRLLLTGVVLAAGFSAATTLLLALSPDRALRGMLFWLMGDLSFSYSPGRLLVLLVAMTFIGTIGARHLDVLARGELQAAILGLPVAPLRFALFAVTALAVALSVTSGGVIGFVGLVVPHAARYVVGPIHLRLLPACAAVGAVFMVLADITSRVVATQQTVPIGVVTALVGVPFFAIILYRARPQA